MGGKIENMGYESLECFVFGSDVAMTDDLSDKNPIECSPILKKKKNLFPDSSGIFSLFREKSVVTMI